MRTNRRVIRQVACRRIARTAAVTAVLLGLAGAAAPVAAQTVVAGSVRVAIRPGVAPSPVVVYAQPLEKPVPAGPASFTLSQKNKAFTPSVLGVPAGSTIAFPNEDAIFHNVFSLSAPMPFDLGLYRSGESKSRVFRDVATYRVFCNIHPQMSAVIVVAPTPYITVTDRQGAFSLTVPPGRYRIAATTGRGAPVTREVTIDGTSATLDPIDVDESGLVEAPHTNKFGKPYPKEAYRR
jgi:plastocyanin